MKCERCGAELDENASFCPDCGWQPEKDAQEASAADELAEEAEELTEEAEEAAEELSEEAEEAAEETEEAAEDAEELSEETAEEAAAKAQKTKKQKRTQTILGILIGVLVIAICALSVVILKNRQAGEDKPYVSYTVAEEKYTERVAERKVASCGDTVLTNAELNVYYWQEFYGFANQYSSYLSYLLDTTKGLDEQLYDEEQTWQELFLSNALEMFHAATACAKAAEAAGYELPQAEQEYLDTFADTLLQEAQMYGFESSEAYLADSFGPHVTAESFEKYLHTQVVASSYLNSLVDGLSCTAEQLSAYYDEHAEEYAQYGLEKIDKPMVSVRHVLLRPEDPENDGVYTDEAWEACRRQAQELYDEWRKTGTEDAFIQLAADHSADGNAASGGIYTDVYPGQMVETFNDWCFDDSRQSGDSGIVETQYGCHIMYFVEQQEEIYWQEAIRHDYLTEQSYVLQDELTARYPMTSDLKKAAIYDILAAVQ